MKEKTEYRFPLTIFEVATVNITRAEAPEGETAPEENQVEKKEKNNREFLFPVNLLF